MGVCVLLLFAQCKQRGSLVVVLVCHHNSPVLIWPVSLPIYTNTAFILPLEADQRRFETDPTKSPQYLLNRRWGGEKAYKRQSKRAYTSTQPSCGKGIESPQSHFKAKKCFSQKKKEICNFIEQKWVFKGLINVWSRTLNSSLSWYLIPHIFWTPGTLILSTMNTCGI